MDDQSYLYIFLIILCGALRFLIAFSQYILQTSKTSRLENMADTYEEKAEIVLHILDNQNRSSLTFKSSELLLTLLISTMVIRLVSPTYYVFAILITWFILMSFTEILPRSIAKTNPEFYALKMVRVIHASLLVLTPLYWLFQIVKSFWSLLFKEKSENHYSEQELLDIVDKAQSEGSLQEAEGDLIRRSIEFNDLDVYSILTPRVDVVAINFDWDPEKIKEVIEESEYSRLPVYKNTIDTIIGVIHVKDYIKMLQKDQSFESIIKQVVFTPTYYEVSKLLRQFQVSKSHMAVVVDEHGGTAGIVTLEDILEELVGEIWDEHDDVELDIQAINPTQYLVSGNTSLDHFFDTFGIEYEDSDYDSTRVGGWVLDTMNKIPEVGEQFDFQHMNITVMEADDRRVYRIMVNHVQSDKESEEL